MNTENLLRVADAIEKHEVEWLGYNQHDWITEDEPDRSEHMCKTTACIAGWAYVVSTKIETAEAAIRSHIAADQAQLWLGLDGVEAARLFRACPLDGNPTPVQAVRTLRYAAEHGVVDWDAANPPAGTDP